MNKDITIIIPVHEFNDTVGELLLKAVESVKANRNGNNLPIKLVLPDKLVSTLDISFFNNLHKYVGENDEMLIADTPNSDFCSLVNYAVSHVETDWFSILEFDDEYTNIWFKNVSKYMDENPETSIFLPIEDIVDFNTRKFNGYGNEAVWATSFSEELGYIDNETIKNFFDFYMTGGVYNKKDWESVGGLKVSMKLTFWYEFLLRTTLADKKVFVIPKVGYVHRMNRDGSLLDIVSKTMDDKEVEWWLETAKTECNFTEDRNKTYDKTPSNE